MMKFCPKCGRETERNSGGDCKVCDNARSAAYRAKHQDKLKASNASWRTKNADNIKAKDAAYRAANHDKVKAKQSAWYAKNRDKVKAKSATYYSANAEKIKTASAIYRAKNPEKVKAGKTAWYAENPEKFKATNAAYRAAHPESLRIHSQNRRARKRAAGGKLSQDLTAKLFKLQKGKCPCCQKPLGKHYHLDHILPLKLGGSNTDDNMQLLRSKCNLQKNAAHPVDFMQSRGLLL